ncbi:flagella synthesis protein FlgN [Kerstersia similis]|uniref:flagella synthesis protein FlgN n=1 Tax=Kerstersia similis TaxID=206505 RepID=UPI0039EEEFF6
MPAQEATAALCLQLKQEMECFQAFSRLLDEEAGLLAAPHSADALRAIAEQKQGYADQLHAHEQHRLTLAAGLLPAAHASLSPMQQAAALPAVRPAWQALVQAGQAAHEKNRRNGIILDVYLKHTEQAIQSLRRDSQQTDLYDAQGRTARAKRSGASHYRAG